MTTNGYQNQKPKICVPVMGAAVSDILEQTKWAVQETCDVIEWRMDYFPSVTDERQVLSVAEQMKGMIGEKQFRATFRTKQEGGERELDAASYETLLRCVGSLKAVDWVDVEYAMLDKMSEKLVSDLKKCGKTVVLSSHDFQKTPSSKEMLSKLEEMEKAGASIGKLAVMPEKEEDVLALLDATLKAKRTLSIPVITMSMSDLGMISRICGELSGSILTFGCTQKASAPGQVPVDKLAMCLELLHQ